MNTVTAIGVGRGLFDIFIPGVFLLLNLVGAFCSLPFDRNILTWQASNWVGSAALGTIAVITFGYLFGVILRVQRANCADRISAWLIRLLRRLSFKKTDPPPIYLTEKFPFIKFLKKRSELYHPKEAETFFNKVWSARASGIGGQSFFNFCKVMLMYENENVMTEINSAEALTRYMASIFYALLISLLFWIISGIAIWIMSPPAPPYIFLIIGIYIVSMFLIMRNLRLIRLKEVETVFAATFKCRNTLFKSNKPSEAKTRNWRKRI